VINDGSQKKRETEIPASTGEVEKKEKKEKKERHHIVMHVETSFIITAAKGEKE